MEQAHNYITTEWPKVISELEAYIKIPNLSPAFDPKWEEKTDTTDAIVLLENWVLKQNLKNTRVDILKEKGLTPLLFIEVSAYNSDRNVLLYGHLDKQPPMESQWAKDLGPYKPVIKDGKLYGRGGADDGYAVFSSVLAIKALQENNLSHPRCVIIIEASEESGSCDLSQYLDKLYGRIKEPNLVICLDSGCGNYEQLWLTTSLRGAFNGILSVKLLKNGVHSGDASGIVPSPFNIVRQLLDRLEDSKTGKLIDACYVNIPKKEVDNARNAVKAIGNGVVKRFPFIEGVTMPNMTVEGLTQYMLNRTWKPTLSYIGLDGLPNVANGGNVVYPHIGIKLSVRLPPTKEPEEAIEAVGKTLTENPPYGAQVKYFLEKACKGWVAPEMSNELTFIVNEASEIVFGKSVQYIGEGGSIPFMGMLTDKFPKSEFIITGVLGPESNAHGPDEFLHLEMAENVTKCVSSVLHKFS